LEEWLPPPLKGTILESSPRDDVMDSASLNWIGIMGVGMRERIAGEAGENEAGGGGEATGCIGGVERVV